MATSGLSKSRNLLARKRLQKRDSARRILLETLEARQLLAVGPQLLGVQPSTGTLLESGEVLHVSPKELIFRFDDSAGIDPTSLSGIRVIRSGDDGVFERASVATDLGSGGQTLVEFYAQQAGEEGNGLQINFSAALRTDNRSPVVTVSGRTISVQMNSNPALETRVEDLLQAFSPSAQTPATALVYALRLRGSQTIGVGRSVDTTRTYVLGGANAAKTSTNFGVGNNLEVRLVARDSGNAGLGISVTVTSRDRGGAGNPIVTVVGKKINVEINSNTRFPTTVQEFVNAINANDSLSASLVEAQLVSGVGATRIGLLPITYSPLTLTGVSDIEIIPAYVGLGDTTREVILRFSEALPDDQYRIEILGQGARVLRNVKGEAFNNGVSRSIAFELDLGAQIKSVVPQPVTRNSAGKLEQSRNQIDIYFNDDNLIELNTVSTVNGIALSDFRNLRNPLYFLSSDVIVFTPGSSGARGVLSPNFYQLFHTANSLTNADDVRVLPSSVRYYPDADRVSLSFTRNLDELTNPSTGALLGSGELRLRVGTNQAVPLAPVTLDAKVIDPADTFAGAANLGGTWTPGAGGSQSIIINSEINNTTPLLLDFPGGSDEPGNRQNRFQDNVRLGADAEDGTSVLFYNFQGNLGVFSNSTLLNAITEQQKQRVREIFSLYEQYLGVRFVESANRGMTVAVGDTRAIVPFEDVIGSGSSGVIELNGPGGTTYEAGNLRSNGQLATVLDIQDFSDSTRSEFGGPFQRAAMQAVGRLMGLGLADESADFTVQAFDSVFAPGVGTEIVLPGDVDIVHGQYLYRPDSKDIDLYQFTVPVAGRMSIESFAERMSDASLLDSEIRLYSLNVSGGWDEIASNDDYFSSDSFLELDLEAGNYIVGVSASGNSEYDPTISDTGLGGRSKGNYQLRMDFQPPAQAVLTDGTGVAFDGDADGAPDGVFNFWFRPAGPSNTKFVDKIAAAGGNGTLATPYNNIGLATAAAKPGDVIRIVGNGGADGQLATVKDNLAYEIGFNNLGGALPDGSTFDVPKDVSVMIDAGAVLKMRRARVGVGSTSTNVDRSAGSLLVLGTPNLVSSTGAVVLDANGLPATGSVFFTSVNDPNLGKNANSAVVGVTPSAGDWGGIDFRNRVDNGVASRKNQEQTGQFLNWVSNAEIHYGGGQVVVDGVSQVIAPIQMVDARPTVTYSSVSQSADAAMSATPDSFLESNFHSPAEQKGVAAFSVDYDRVGPELNNNRVVGNSINGLQIRLRTAAGTSLEKMTVQGRFDDTDIVHFIPENLEIAGTAGGAVLANEGPSSSLVNLTQQVGGALSFGFYNYRFTSVNSSGVESAPSEPTSSLFVFNPGAAIILSNLPIGINRIYRSSASGVGPYELVGAFTSNSTTFVDNGSTLGVLLSESLPAIRTRLDARLAIDAGTIIKSQGARIDVTLGAQLIAEASDGNPVVFTSLIDARYGAGGTFDTANRAGAQAAADGDWGGIYVGHTSKASLDYAVIAFGGGTTRIEGGFADFNALEVHQADLRLTHSRLEFNDNGAKTATSAQRGGRGPNDVGTIFVRAAQPVIADNIINNNMGPAMSFNVSALNSILVDDHGRSTGLSQKIEGIVGNHGPLIAGNRIDNNPINGLVVRGGSLTTEGYWDDTDIVHVVQSEIVVPDHQHFGGLRLASSTDQSLVVKLAGGNSGFTASGVPIDNANRIGGSVQLIGNPDNPVILTSLDDCSVGAGFTVEGMHQTDTHNTGFCSGETTGVNFVDVIVVMDESGSMGFAQQFAIGFIAGLDADLRKAGIGNSAAGGNLFGLVGYADINTVPRTIPVGAGGQLFGTAAEYGTASANLVANGAIEDGYQAIHYALDNYTFRPGAQKFVILVTNEDRDVVDASLTYANTLARLDAENVTLEGIVSASFFDSQGNTALALDSASNAYTEDGNGGFVVTPNGTVQPFFFDTTVTDYVDMVFDTQGIAGDINQIQAGGLTAESFGKAAISSIVGQAGGNPAAAGDWRSVLFDTYSNDRNVAIVSELESPLSNSPSANDNPSRGQFLGSLAPDEKSGDENRRLGFQVEGVISKPSDVDVYSFNANAGTEVWLDIDRTLNSLDTVIELVDADGRTLALSDSSLLEEADPTLLYVDAEIAAQSVFPLRKSSPEFYFTSALGTPKDLNSTNPQDAGMRIRLPGEPGTNNLYHVRVRSSSLRTGDPASKLVDPAQLGAGLTKGSYQLQLRLREVDEVPGSGVSYADVRFATNGFELVGVPGNSPLLGENSEVEVRANGTQNDAFANAQALGNLLTTNRQALSVAGNLDDFTDVDWFSFDINYASITPTALREYFSTIIDVDYADGIGRPDTSVYVFNAAGNLILGGLGSGVVDDQASTIGGAGSADLGKGSAGNLDPYIGSYELPAGRYFVAITNSDMVPAVLATYTDPNFADPEMRLQPIEGISLIAEDHVEGQGGSTAFSPTTPILLPNAGDFDGTNFYTSADDAIVDYQLGDIALYVSQDVGNELTNIYIVNPFTGQVRNQVGRGGFDIQDIDFRPNGQLRAFDRPIESRVGGNVDRDTLSDYINIDPSTAQFTDIGDLGLQTNHLQFDAMGVPSAAASDDGMSVEAIAFAVLGGQERGFLVANRPTPFFDSLGNPVLPQYYASTGFINNNGQPGFTRPGPSYLTNVLYEFDENTGTATSAPGNDKTNLGVALGAGTAIQERGHIETYTLDALGNIVTASSTLLAREVTASSPSSGATFIINDGDIFSVRDAGGFQTRFEFDLGPQVLVNYSPAAGRFVTDGMKFQLDATTYEFDTGSVVVVNAFSGSQLSDGSTVRVRNAGGVEKIFEFDNNNQVVGAGNIAVPYSALTSQAGLVQALAAAINSQTGFGVTAQFNANSNRLSLVGASTTAAVQITGTGLAVSGTPGVAVGSVRIPISEAATLQQFLSGIASAVTGGVTVSYEAGRMNFSGATLGNFADLENAGIFVNVGSTGAVGGGNVAVKVLASDTAETVAARITKAINGSLIPGLSAVANGDQVQLSGVLIQNAGPLQQLGVAPGGIVTGIAVIGNNLYAVSDTGGLYVVNNPTSLRSGNVATYITTSYDLVGINFTGLVEGPTHVQNGQLSQLLFGIDSAGNIHAFDTAGRLQKVFANGATSVNTGLSGANGLTMSSLDFNLWHETGQRSGDAGHGLPNTPNSTRVNFTGGSSFYFGFQNPGINGVGDLSGANSTGLSNSYDFPGGASGALESVPFSLAGISAGDLPTLYFTYRFDTEQAASDLGLGNNANDYMRDSLRVYASGEDGQWILLATNNDPAPSGSNVGFFDDEFDTLLTGNADVQPLFDNNGQFRQARVPLGVLAGQENVKLRFEFSSNGGFGYGLSGGRGPEIRTVKGERLVDGEQLVINGQIFEIEMGPSLTLPGGTSLANGNSVTIDGTRYIFTDGSLAVAAPDVAVLFSRTQTSSQIADSLLAAIQTATPVISTVVGLNYSNESNETIQKAEKTGITGDSVRVIGSGRIGDNPTLSDIATDVDMVRIDADRGAVVTVSVEAASIGSSLDSYLRVFDSEGRALQNQFGQPIQNDNRPGSSDSFLTFTVPSSGAYYIGVSGAGNQFYNAAVEGTGSVGSTGIYNLVINVQRAINPLVSGNRLELTGARTVSVPVGSPIALQGALGSVGQPVFVTLDMTDAQVAAALQQSVADYFAAGATAAYRVSGNTVDLTGLVQYNGFDFLTGLRTPTLNDLDPGPFGATTNFVGDAFSAFNTSTNFDGSRNNAQPGALGTQNNAFEGVYLDDFIIGVAGHGEMVLRATGGNTNFVQDPQKAISNPDQFNPEILIGPYQFEIRGGADYGVPLLDGFPVTLALTNTFSPNERSGAGLSIKFNSAAFLLAGDTFTLGDGTRTLTFEMDDINDAVSVQPGNISVPFSTAVINPANGARRSETAQVIAARVRDIINSPLVQSQIKVTANLLNNDPSGSTSDTVVLFGQASTNVPASIGQKIVTQAQGASNRERLQGQVVINAAKVSNSRGFGVTIDSAPRDPLTNATIPGSPRNTVTVNTEKLTPGAVVMNSEFLFNGSGGISVNGDPLTVGVPSAAVPFVRLVNNTIVGGTVSEVSGLIPTIEGGQLFEIGSLAFADAVSSYNPAAGGGPVPSIGLDDPSQALGSPNYTGSGEPKINERVVSLGRGGQIVLEFTNNFLTGSGDAGPDLMIFEVGDSEEVLVEISADGNRYTNVGRASGASPRIDIDAFGFNRNSRIAFVRLTDIASQGSVTGESVGADIDAVGAISSVASENATPGGQGIVVANNGTATLLNNVIVNTTTAINVDASSASTIVGGTVFQRNTNNVAGSATLGQFPTVLGRNVPVFVSAGTGNLYPAPSSPLIDSSIDSLQDRPSIVAVKQPLGIAASPILSPQFDIKGQLRVDDPAVETPSGLGENVFKDRGAQDRADFVGPSVILKTPVDNDNQGLDTNSDPTIVELTNITLKHFDIQIIDGLEPSDPNSGTGVNNATVFSSSVLVYRNGQPLVEGIDYRFGYDGTNGIVRLQPLAGIWQAQSVYTIRFVNARESGIVAMAASTYSDGDQFVILDATGSKSTFEFDLGFVLSVPSTNGIDPLLTDGSTFIVDDGIRRLTYELDTDGLVLPAHLPVSLGTSPTLQSAGRAIQSAIQNSGINAQVTEISAGKLQIQGARGLQFDVDTSGLSVTGKPGVQTVFGLQIPLQQGQPSGLVDGQTFTIDRSGSPVSFEIDTNGTVLPGNVPVRFASGASAAQVGAALVTAINGASLGLSPSYDGNGLVRLGGDANTRLVLTDTVLTQTGIPGASAAISIPLPLGTNASPTNVASLIKSVVEAQNLAGISITQFGSRLVLDGAQGVSGTGANLVPAIRDLAGNPLKPNQLDGSTTLTVFLGEGLDYGDAPAPYASLAADNGPRHKVIPGLNLGATVTSDADAKLSNADLDDGLVFTSAIYAAFQTNLQVSVTNTTGAPAYMSLWIDVNRDGFFAANEKFVSQQVTQATTPFSILVPSSAIAGQTYVRVRLSSDQAAVNSPIGAAPDGEVEDHLITILANPYTNAANNLDVSGDGFVSPIDVLQLVNYLNNPSNPTNLTLPAPGEPPYLDVNGDGVVSPIDALLIVNFLNSRSSGEGEMGGDLTQAFNLSNQHTVLASNWAAGLESIVRGPIQQPVVRDTSVGANDAALLLSEDEETQWLASETATIHWADSNWSSVGMEEAEQEEMLGLHDQLLDELFN